MFLCVVFVELVCFECRDVGFDVFCFEGDEVKVCVEGEYCLIMCGLVGMFGVWGYVEDGECGGECEYYYFEEL